MDLDDPLEHPPPPPSRRCQADPVDGISQYYRSVWRDSSFRSSAGQRWAVLRGRALSDNVLRDMVAQQAGAVQDAAMRNYQRWSFVYDSSYFSSHLAQWQYEVERLRAWLLGRAKWMDAALADAAGGGQGVVPGWPASASNAPTPGLPAPGLPAPGLPAPGLPAQPAPGQPGPEQPAPGTVLVGGRLSRLMGIRK
ncbi:hypothetical protein TSOC_013560 [Tetrabaena socialis]|uniref:Uncharacterized protein n=1 Tax=Tetrabaena socialis TaxID=47790 RepID=A0A2J7ZK07_9CHLO|nr:hypothetical protein TSOC_013560 [Tetrabaena socialis]|eukprot:PNH00608.1 hypothetical protein TSOC_013560 [Tetrabaena socialis]